MKLEVADFICQNITGMILWTDTANLYEIDFVKEKVYENVDYQ